MSNSDLQWRPFIPFRDIIHPEFTYKEKHITPRTIPSKGPPKMKKKKKKKKKT